MTIVCNRCVMDTSARDIYFDTMGICNFCTEFLERSGELFTENNSEKSSRLNNYVQKVKNDGYGKKYDCIVGVSGGVDSAWALVQAKKLGLRPLAVHMDNGWNSELAQNNIANLVSKLGVDLHTHVVNWNEYRTLMQAFFSADVIDVELLYDNAMLAVNYQMARKYGVKHILGGTNQSTEGMLIPSDWNWFKNDKKNIKSIALRSGFKRFQTFPSIGTFQLVWCHFIKKIRWISFLDYFDYQKFEALDFLEQNYQFKRYPYKHYESVFTRFYQGYILPQKFNVDKRKVHLSTLIISGQISRDEAINLLNDIPYPSQRELDEDMHYFLKKMGWSKSDLQQYIKRPEVRHDAFRSEKKTWLALKKIYEFLFSVQKR